MLAISSAVAIVQRTTCRATTCRSLVRKFRSLSIRIAEPLTVRIGIATTIIEPRTKRRTTLRRRCFHGLCQEVTLLLPLKPCRIASTLLLAK
jgi:hypothetical protein